MKKSARVLIENRRGETLLMLRADMPSIPYPNHKKSFSHSQVCQDDVSVVLYNILHQLKRPKHCLGRYSVSFSTFLSHICSALPPKRRSP